jgi:hypothetical protein|tara:strand:- start:9006 stop:9302 length:297 start_codon:yes stop_codon:yes gene_type:complete
MFSYLVLCRLVRGFSRVSGLGAFRDRPVGISKNAREPIHGGLGRAVNGAPHFLKSLPACPLFNFRSGFPGEGDSQQPNSKAVPAVWVVRLFSRQEKDV